MTDTYRFHSGFYGLTDMPAELQKAMDYILIGLENKYRHFNDILIVSKTSQEEHKQVLINSLLMKKL